MPGPRRRSPFSFSTELDRFNRATVRHRAEQQRTQELDDIERTLQAPHPRPIFGPAFTQTRPRGNIWQQAGQLQDVNEEPSTLLGGKGVQENVPRRTIFGQEAQAFAEQVAPREHRRHLIPEDQPFGLPGRIAREVTAVDPGTIMLAPLVGPNVFGRGALEAAPTLKQLAGTALTAVGADLPIAAGQIGRAGLRRVASEAGGGHLFKQKVGGIELRVTRRPDRIAIDIEGKGSIADLNNVQRRIEKIAAETDLPVTSTVTNDRLGRILARKGIPREQFPGGGEGDFIFSPGRAPSEGGAAGHADLTKAPAVINAPKSGFHGTGAKFEAFKIGRAHV